MKHFLNARFTGHESFPLRVGWLRKYYDAVTRSPEALAEDDTAILELGIGKNMVRSLEFWAESAQVAFKEDGKYQVGPVGKHLFDESTGVDPYMEKTDTVALIHWTLCTTANLAAWNAVFGSRMMNRFTKQQLIDHLAAYSKSLGRSLSASTLDQHVSIFLNSYCGIEVAEDATDPTTCPLHELDLIRRSGQPGKHDLFELKPQERLNVTPNTFGRLVASFWMREYPGADSLPFDTLLNGTNSPGVVFRLTSDGLERAIESLDQLSNNIFRLVDTADTRRVTLSSTETANEWAAV